MQYRKDFVKSDGRRLSKGGPRDQQLRAKSQSESALTETLINQIAELKSELSKVKSGESVEAPRGFYTPEQVDEEIRKAVSQAMAEAAVAFKKNNPNVDTEIDSLIKTYKKQILDLQKNNDDFAKMHKAILNENKELKEKMDMLNQQAAESSDLKKQIAVLEQTLEGKEELINTLKSKPMIINGQVVNAADEDPDRPKMEQVFVDPLDKQAGEGLKASIKSKELSSDDDSNMGDKVNKLKDLLGTLPTRK